jgi:putative mRNA 3-end processing factor
VLVNIAPVVAMSECGLVVYDSGRKILLDPKKESASDLMFFSHAHSDHMMKTRKKDITYAEQVLTSTETFHLARTRGVDLSFAKCKDFREGYQLIDTCHVLGSRGLLIEDKIYYTGDISTRRRGFMGGANVPKVDVLIVESTFGSSRYVFPPVEDVIHLANKIIAEMFDRGLSVILFGYPLGKAQLLTQLFQHWSPLFICDSVAKINAIYRNFGIRLKEGTVFSSAKEESSLLKSAPWLMIAPMGSARSAQIRGIKERCRAISIGFSGWAIDKKYKFMMGLDYALPLSDHCDYEELVRLVLSSRARKIYTFHGFSVEFARSLRDIGLDAEPVTRLQKSRPVKMSPTIRGTLDSYL